MSRPKRHLTVAAALVLLLITAEVALNLLRSPMAQVKIVNEGATPIEDLRVTAGRQEARVAWIGPKESVRLSIAAGRRRGMKVSFHQEGNALTGFEIEDFDPRAMRRDGTKLVLTIEPPDQFGRSFEDDPAPSALGRVLTTIWRWLDRVFETP